MDGHSGGPSKPTLRTIAQITGFAVTTVSRALSGDERIAARTRATIESTAREIGYIPDRAARRLRTGRTQVIGLLLNPDHEFLGFANELLYGITEALAGTGYAVSIMPDLTTGDRLATMRNILRNRLADGVVFTRTECFDERVRYLLENDFPFISHGRTEFTTPHPFADYDNEAFARAAVARLVALGRTRIAIVLPEDRFTFAQHLRHGFMAGIREAGVAYDILEGVHLDHPAEDIARALRTRLAQPDPPDGIVCVGEVMALTTLSAVTDMGRTPGREIDLVAKRASPIFDLIRPRIETVFEDVRATGHTIGTLLLRRINGEDAANLNAVQHPIGSFAGSI